ncbi:hypothetical protein G6F57_008397 [Rhizopus arrhizus]|uniref:Transposase n=1 Tax=Rhizopus oryzae TaxID=64495 RepID=A0A9P7BNA6_RHIOR|nr:hypothetical protein G6F23_008464 [Rhizopus arrhizus]KAG1412538.1 hypothetical protein G6F58_007959 [Rhizopus delemar]KAG0756379.1 hypothetical protein G6F24_011191 [Rhizopus arrhizus]KAG0910710.1 hypothetical protein G6F33_007648 [Rhizopus arrhizus]KAG0935547.1 hypothetical protein G6F32_010369 [Rhizopus arrhizus]
MSARISIDCTCPLITSEDETKEKIAELIGLNKSTMHDIKARIDNYGSPLPHKQIGRPLKKLFDRLDFKSYRAAHKPRLTARHGKSGLRWAKEHPNWTEDQWGNVVWSDGFRFCVEGSKRDQETYINILANMFHPWFTNDTVHQGSDFIFQEDGASCRTVWNALERQIERKRLSIKNLQQLKVALQEEWARLDDEFADRFVRSMKRRCEAVIKAKGGATEY